MSENVQIKFRGEKMTTDAQHLKKVLFSYASMIVCGLLITSAAILTARFFNFYYPMTAFNVKLFEYLGYICWCATLVVGWETPAQKGLSPSDRLYQSFSTTFSLLGVYTFVLARELVPISLG